MRKRCVERSSTSRTLPRRYVAILICFFFNDTATTEIYTLSLHDALPIYGVNHLAAHVAVDTLEHGPLPEPAIAMLVSGGHSSLLLVDDLTNGVTPLGATIDDAAGEAFDKVARLLGLGFPGGPAIDRTARAGSASIAFPRGLTAAKDL